MALRVDDLVKTNLGTFILGYKLDSYNGTNYSPTSGGEKTKPKEPELQKTTKTEDEAIVEDIEAFNTAYSEAIDEKGLEAE
mgnify:CR=1 FL=1